MSVPFLIVTLELKFVRMFECSEMQNGTRNKLVVFICSHIILKKLRFFFNHRATVVYNEFSYIFPFFSW
jgi:hypothetical protein